MGYSSWSSFASKLQNKSKISFSTSSTRAVCLSTLLITTRGLSPLCKAFWRTNFVYGIGPSVAHTTKHTPSTIDIIRSTSPPKSWWPGVSTILSLWSPWITEVHLLKIVMPLSYSKSLLSIALSEAKAIPVYFRRQSTKVVFPWSTWAMIAILRTLEISPFSRISVTLLSSSKFPFTGDYYGWGAALEVLNDLMVLFAIVKLIGRDIYPQNMDGPT